MEASFNWHLFSDIFNAFDQPLTAGIDAAVSNLISYINPILKSLLTMYIVFIGFQTRWMQSGAPISGLFAHALRAAVVVMVLANTSTFNEWVGSLFLHTIPTEIGAALNGTLGAGGGVVGGSQFDDLWNSAWKAGLIVYKNLPEWSFKGAMLTLAVILFWGMSFLSVAIGFLLFLGGHVATALLVIVGPIFIACAIFPVTRRFFSGWLATTVSILVTKILVIAMISLMVQVQKSELIRAGGDAADFMAQVGSLISLAGLLFICGRILYQIPSLAMGIAGGGYHSMNDMVGSAGGAIKSVVTNAPAVATKAASAVSSAGSSAISFAKSSLSSRSRSAWE